MSAALQLATVWGASNQQLGWQQERRNCGPKPAAKPETKPAKAPASEPVTSLAFYRKHTESMLRRYLYASAGPRRSWAIRYRGDGPQAGRFVLSRTRSSSSSTWRNVWNSLALSTASC
jgi:hypothetical protein